MADPISHTTQGALMMVAPFIFRIKSKVKLWSLITIGALLGGAPDLIGWYGYRIEHDKWQLYENAHTGPISDILWYIPMSALHLYLDKVTHGLGDRWDLWSKRTMLEAALWVVNISIIILFVKIWKKNRIGISIH